MTVVNVFLIMQGQQHRPTAPHNNNRETSSHMQGQQHSQTNHKFNGYLMRRHQPSPQEAHWIKSMATAKLLALPSLQPVAPEGHEIPGPHGDSGCGTGCFQHHADDTLQSKSMQAAPILKSGLCQRELSMNESMLQLI